MIFNQDPHEAYVWIWPPEQTEPVVVGKLTLQHQKYYFNYGKSYLQRDQAFSLYEQELPLQKGLIAPHPPLMMPNCIRDASPDAWGRRVILNRYFGSQSEQMDTIQLNELSYLLESGSDRIGALDFQKSGTEYIPRLTGEVSLNELLDSVNRVEQGIPLTPELDGALFHGTSIGGARPKAFIEHDNIKYIAKFSSSTDIYSVEKLEFIAMRLASKIGLNVPAVKLVKVNQKDVLLIERFDRIKTEKGWMRRLLLSALTLLGLDEMQGRYASYEKLAEIIRYRFAQPKESLKELFSRLIFNILISNTDDHARNHAAFWDGQTLSLTPAYDLCPQSRSGNVASQAMLISGLDRRSQLNTCLQAASHFLLSHAEAMTLMQQQIQLIKLYWDEVCEEANLSSIEKNFSWRRQFLNDYAFEGLDIL